MTEILTFNYLLLIRLVAAVICGGIIGWESVWREELKQYPSDMDFFIDNV